MTKRRKDCLHPIIHPPVTMRKVHYMASIAISSPTKLSPPLQIVETVKELDRCTNFIEKLIDILSSLGRCLHEKQPILLGICLPLLWGTTKGEINRHIHSMQPQPFCPGSNKSVQHASAMEKER